MNRDTPSPVQPRLQRETRIFKPTLIQKFSRAVRQCAPDQSGNRIDHEPELIFSSPGSPETTCALPVISRVMTNEVVRKAIGATRSSGSLIANEKAAR